MSDHEFDAYIQDGTMRIEVVRVVHASRYAERISERDALRARAASLEDALGSLQEMLAKQLMGLADGVQCAACGVRADTETHADNCPVKNGLAIIDAALAKNPNPSGDDGPAPTHADARKPEPEEAGYGHETASPN